MHIPLEDVLAPIHAIDCRYTTLTCIIENTPYLGVVTPI